MGLFAVLAVSAPPARADPGAGLYAPFPDASQDSPTKTFLRRAGITDSRERLSAGVQLAPFGPAAEGAATGPGDRAGLHTSSTGWGLALIVLGVLIAIACIRVRRIPR